MMVKRLRILFVVVVLSLNLVCALAVDYSGSDVVGVETIVDDLVTPSDEQWRLEANQRIDQHRKANMQIQVFDEHTGLPVPGVEIEAKLTKHQFRFGGIVRAKTLMGVDSNIDQQLYRNTFLNMGFNASGFNNALKQKQRSGQEPYIRKKRTQHSQTGVDY